MKFIGYISFVLALLASIVVPNCSQKSNKTKAGEISIPKFYLEPHITQCRLDSPEIFYYGVALPSVSSLLEEGKIFFGVLMDRLESSLAGAEKYEDLEKEWTFLMNVISESFELAIARIHTGWYAIIDNTDVMKLPWEAKYFQAVILERFNYLVYQYQVLEAVVKAGTKEIVGSLQKYLMEVMEKLEDSVFTEPTEDGRLPTEDELLLRMETTVSQLEPNFVGNLLKRLLKMARTKKLNLEMETSPNFLQDVMQEISITVEAYKTQSRKYPNFWLEMTDILKSVNGSVNPSTQDLLEFYLTEEDTVIDIVISLLTMNLHEYL